MKKLFLCFMLIMALCFTACSGDEKETEGFGLSDSDKGTSSSKDNTASGNESKNSGSTAGDSGKNTDKNDGQSGTDIGKNAVGSDIAVTDGTVAVGEKNTFNIGGIIMQVPEEYTMEKVFVGAGLTFESTKSSAVLREYYYDTEKMDGLKPDFDVTDESLKGEITNVYYPNYVIFDAEKFVAGEKNSSVEYNVVNNYLDEYENISDEEITVAGFKGRKVAYKGKTWQDCYREGPVKQFVDATLDITVIFNDIDRRAIVITNLCKNGKYEAVNKQLNTMLETAAAAQPGDDMTGLYGAKYTEIGGYSMEIPESFGQLLDSYYEMYGETYVNCYGSKSEISSMLGQSAYMIAQMQSQFGDMGFGGFVGGFEETPEDFGGYEGDFSGDWGDFSGDFEGDAGDFGGDMGGFGTSGPEDEFARLLKNMDKGWLNLTAIRSIDTTTEFEKLLKTGETAIPDLFLEIIPEGECTLNERVEIDGMKGIRFTFTAELDGEETEFKLVIVNNYKSRFVVIASTAVNTDSEQSEAFEELLGSMKNLMK